MSIAVVPQTTVHAFASAMHSLTHVAHRSEAHQPKPERRHYGPRSASYYESSALSRSMR
jgi:hypothetical protein